MYIVNKCVVIFVYFLIGNLVENWGVGRRLTPITSSLKGVTVYYTEGGLLVKVISEDHDYQ